MRRVWLCMAATALFIGACSDDDVEKDTGVPDVGNDIELTEAGTDMAKEAGTDMPLDDVGTDTAPTKKFAGSMVMSQVEGVIKPGSPAVKMFNVVSLFLPGAGGDPTITPDFADSPTPPNCVGWKWTATSPPNKTTGDAGDVTFKGHAEVNYVDGMAQPPTPAPLPATITCTRKQVGTSNLYSYDCGLPAATLLPAGDALTTTTSVDIAFAGSTDIPAGSETGIKPPANPLKPKAPFDLTQIDPSGTVKVEWEMSLAPIVVISIQAQLADGSEGADINCATLGLVGNHTIPAGALALMPTPTATNPLMIRTMMNAVNMKTGQKPWGQYGAGVGRGTVGVTCRTPAGLCP